MGQGLLNSSGSPAGHFRRIDGSLWAEEVPVQQLAGEYGTPLYIYSRRTILERYREIDAAFANVDKIIAYSVKANGNLSILNLLASEGAGADVVSGGELFRARKAGVPPERIVFGGVGKTRTELAAALHAGVYGFNVESEEELRALSELASAAGQVAPVALRINPDIDSPAPHQYIRTGHRASKFGVASDEALPLYRLAAKLPGIRIRGIAVHIGSQILDARPYLEALLCLLDLVAELRRAGIELEYLDIGGGFGVSDEHGDSGPPIATFAEALVPHLATSRLRLLLEPGRYIVAPAGILVARVLYVKKVDQRVFVVTDAGMNDLLRPSHYSGYHPVEPTELVPGRAMIRADIVGPICETGDFLALDRLLPGVRSGELLAIRYAGAYGFSMASTYNARPRAAEVLADGRTGRLIRRRETYADLVRGEEDLLE